MLVIPKAYIDGMISRSLEEDPNECCGILVGTRDQVHKLYRARNVEASPVKYLIDPKDMFRAYSEAEQNDWDIVAFYHSHTTSEAYPSPTDVRLSTWPESLYILVSLQDYTDPVVRGFHIVEGKVSEEELVIED